MLGFFLKVFVAALLATVMVATAAGAQTTTSTAQQSTTTSSNEGAFDELSPGNQKIARALFEAQKTDTASSPTKSLTLDDIAAMKQSGKGWGQVFQEMKAQGLVQEKNLGQVVSRANHAARATPPASSSSTSSGTMITTGSGRTHVVGAKGKSEGAMSRGKGSLDDNGQRTSSGGSISSSSHGRSPVGSDSRGHGSGNFSRGVGRGR